MDNREPKPRLGTDFACGLWRDLNAKGLAKRDQNHGWVFAYYIQTPSDRGDDCWYEALLFRNVARTVFGIKEFTDLVHQRVIERMTARVVQDEVYRETLMSDAPILPLLWKRH